MSDPTARESAAETALRGTRRWLARTAALASLGIAALLVGWLQLRQGPTTLAGRWSTQVQDAFGVRQSCDLEILPSGIAQLTGCPEPWGEYHGTVASASRSIHGARGVYALLAPGRHALLGEFVVTPGTGLLARPRLKMVSASSTTIDWQRSRSDVDAAAVDLFPSGSTWPPRNLPTLVDRARYFLQLTWRPDAVIMDVTLDANGADLSGGGALHWDRGELRITGFSPQDHRFRSFLGSALGARDLASFTLYQADAAFAVPERFLDLPDALDEAAAHGYATQALRRAGLRYWSTGGASGSASRPLGLGWLLINAANEAIYLPALPNQGAVECIRAAVDRAC